MDPELKRLIKERDEMRARAKEIVALAEREQREPTVKEQTEFDFLAPRIEERSAEIETYLLHMPMGHAEPANRNCVVPGDDDYSRTVDGGSTKGRSYRSLFPSEEITTGGFRNLREYLEVVHSDIPDSRLRRSMLEGMPSSGGFLVPAEFVAQLLDESLDDEIIRPRAKVIPLNSPDATFAGPDNLDRSSGNISGWSAQWLGEGVSADEHDGEFRSVALKAKTLRTYTSASNELVSSGMNFEQIVEDGLRDCIGFALDSAFLLGTGAGQPLGIMSSPSLITVSKEANQPADTIVYENLVKMYARMYNRGKRRGIWIANNTTLPQLQKLSIAIGTGGAWIPAMKEESGRFSILGLPVEFTEHMAALGDLGDIVLVDPTQYVIGMVKDMVLEKSGAVHWATLKTAYRCWMRLDGQGTWHKSLTPKVGDTLSWVIALEAR